MPGACCSATPEFHARLHDRARRGRPAQAGMGQAQRQGDRPLGRSARRPFGLGRATSRKPRDTRSISPCSPTSDRKVATLYGMIHAETRSQRDGPGSVFIIDPNKKVRLILTYPPSAGRNFAEILRAIDSLQLTDARKVSTPVNWQKGQPVIISPSLVRRGRQAALPARLDRTEALSAHRPALKARAMRTQPSTRRPRQCAKPDSPQTIAAANGGRRSDGGFGAIAPPVYLSTSFAFKGFDDRADLRLFPGRQSHARQLAETLAKLEGGAGAVGRLRAAWPRSTSSLARREPGDLVLAPHDCYGGTYKLLSLRARQTPVRSAVRGSERHGGRGGGHAAQAEPRSGRNAQQPAHAHRRYPSASRRSRRPSARRSRSTTPFMSPALAAADRARGGLRHPFDDEISQRPFGCPRRRRHRGGQEQDATISRSWANATGVIGPPSTPSSPCADSRTLFPRIEQQQRSGSRARRVSGARIKRGREGLLSGLAVPSRTRDRQGAAEGLRRHAKLRARGRAWTACGGSSRRCG